MGNIAALGNTVVQTTPVGVIQPFAGINVPAGWLFCDGSAISRIQYPELFSALSTTYGSGDGSTTFNIPDLRGRVPAGKDNMGGVAANRLTSANSGITATSLGANGGDERLHQHTHTQNAHGHTVTNIKWTGSSHTHQNTGGYFAEAPWPAGGDATPAGVPATTATNQNTGSGNSQNVQPTLIVNYIIKAVADLPRASWTFSQKAPVVTQFPSNPTYGDEVYFKPSASGDETLFRYNGTSWKCTSGIVRVGSLTVATGACTLDGIFSSYFDDYLVEWSFVPTGNTFLGVRFRSSGVEATSNYAWTAPWASSVTNTYGFNDANNSDSRIVIGYGTNGARTSGFFHIHGVNLTTQTIVNGQGTDNRLPTQIVKTTASGILNTTTQYDGLVIYSSGNNLAGTMTIYGMTK